METAAQRCERIVAALEDLAAQEAAAIQTHDFSSALAVQDRAEPLVDFLARNASLATAARLNDRVAAVQELRSQTGEKLGAELARTRAELQQMQLAQVRVAQVAPAYGRTKPAAGNWRAVG